MSTYQIEGKEYDENELQVLVKAGALSIGAKHDTSSTTIAAVPPHGPLPGDNTKYGIFSGAGYRPGVWNGTPRVRSIGQVIPLFKSTWHNELIEVATGVTAGSGNNVTSACTVGPKPGALKAARISASFGIVHMSTKIADITQAGMRRNRADVDRDELNRAMVENPWLPQVPGMLGDGIYNSLLRSEMYALGIELERNVSQVHFVGVSGTENNTYRGVARQWNGLDALIKTGWTDADSGVAVPGLDANVQSFNAVINGDSADGRNIVETIQDAYYSQTDYLRQIGITPEFVLVMRPELFRRLAEFWACSYAIGRCDTGTEGSPVLREGTATRALFDAMIQGQYLLIDGTQVPVVVDDTIAREVLGNNYYKSDIYGVALRGNGRPTLYGEYFDMGNAEAMELANAFGLANSETTTVNSDMYRVFKRVTGGCYEFDFFARPRLITDAPFMHFRVDDVFYYSYLREHNPLPGGSHYYDGGLTYR